MRIAVVSEHASPLAAPGVLAFGGQSGHVAELSAAMVRRGHEVTVYTRRTDPRARAQVVTGAGYRVIHVPAGPPVPLPVEQTLSHLGEFGTYLQRHWARDTPDLVHAHHWMSGLAAELAARVHNLPVVVSFHTLGVVKRRHEGLADTSPRSRIRFERMIATRAAQVLATCADEAVELARMGVPRFRTSVVPAGVDATRFDPDGPALERSARRRVVSVGKLVRRKGFETAIKALQELPSTELLVAGGPVGDDVEEGSEARRLRRVADEYGVADRVRLLGTVSRARLPQLLRSADVVLCTPWYAPFGRVALEAMACRKPVVATAVGGLLDTVVDGVTGRLVAPPEPIAVARAVRPLLDDATLRETWGVAGYQRACTRYTWERAAIDTVAAYRRAVPECAERISSSGW
ncbi:glycosyltransferase [Nocardia sp. NPDC052566]|uniref:glycosyltransferase n=1 Tax=Nocardia sp. NPDC052566 TaxID=3364330 RepID=UPI0037CCAB2F